MGFNSEFKGLTTVLQFRASRNIQVPECIFRMAMCAGAALRGRTAILMSLYGEGIRCETRV